jgi:hypothetical protein
VRGELDALSSCLHCKAKPSSLAGDDHENTLSSLVTYLAGSSPFVTGGFKFEPEPRRYVLKLHFCFECGEIDIGRAAGDRGRRGQVAAIREFWLDLRSVAPSDALAKLIAVFDVAASQLLRLVQRPLWKT